MDRTRNERESRPKFMACCCDVTAVKCNNEKLMVQKSLVLEQLHAAASVDRQTLTAHDASAQPHASAGRRCQSKKASRRRRRRRNWRRRRVLFSIAIVPTTALNSSRWSLTSSTRPTSSLAWTHSASSSETFSSSPPFSASFAPSASTSSSSAPCSAVTSS